MKKSQYMSMEQAIGLIKHGDRVVVGHAMGEPVGLIEAMNERREELHHVEVVHMVSYGTCQHCAKEAAGHFRHNTFFASAASKMAIYEGRADFTPCYFSEIPKMFRENYLPVDVALIQVSKPDRNGFVSLGISVDYTMAAAKCAKLVIAQVNEAMPRTLGDSFLHLSEIDCLVEKTEPLPELLRKPLSYEELEIGKNCAKLIPDGATLQLGIGALPDAVLMSLKEKKDLGIHSEMFSDGVMELVKSGVITNRKKSLHNGKLVASFLMGSKALYEFADNNPMVYMAPVDYVNDPYIISRHENLISINSCTQVDFQGQVCSESVGSMQISGVGGQVDFVRGANLSAGGKSIIAIQSTAKNGTASKIVPILDEGAAVTTGRNDVDYIITEYGIARLKGRTLRERARSLIAIAHPDFREDFIYQWEEKFRETF